MVAKYFNSQNDLVFKKMFDREKRKSIPSAFLKAVREEFTIQIKNKNAEVLAFEP